MIRLLLILALGAGLRAQAPPDPAERRPPKGPEAGVFLTEVPAHPGSVLLGRPTRTTVTVSLLWQQDVDAELVWGRDPEHLPSRGRTLHLRAGVPQEVLLEGLEPDAAHAYALLDAASRRRLLPVGGLGAFHTARPPGAPFTFTLTADSHLDGGCSLERYRQTLAAALAQGPDFHIDLGDTFMTDKHASREEAAKQYAAQRFHLGALGQAAPLFLVLGNHDGEAPDRRGQTTADGLAVWAHAQRTRLFPNPVPDAFYSGNDQRHPVSGLLQDHYAWTWGDALFVVLDPFWTSRPTRGGQDPWAMTLGDVQYAWLDRTLRASKAAFKFVFIHQLTGSAHPAGRGGREAAAFQEWGGRDLDGQDTFAAHRPSWPRPIHALLVEAGVTAVFHGHDHFYARQELDGITYQLVPQPAHRNDRSHHAEEYGYASGDFLPGSGHLRVQVTPTRATVTFLRSGRDGLEEAARYELPPRKPVTAPSTRPRPTPRP